jgi:hypothetical protein
METDPMKLLRTFTTSDAVEGAVEVRLELSEALVAYRSRVWILLIALLAGVILAIWSMALQSSAFGQTMVSVFERNENLDYLKFIVGMAFTMLMIIAIALGISIILFVSMMRRFFAVLRARYGTFAKGGMGTSPRVANGKLIQEATAEAGMVKDPARMLLGLAKEAEEEIPQVDNLLKYSTMFTLLLALMSIAAAGMTALGVTHVPDSDIDLITGLHIASAMVLAGAVLLLVEAHSFVKYFMNRVDSLETFEATGPMPVPAGKDPIDRFANCVLAKGQAKDYEQVSKQLAGASGQRHVFDMVLGGPGERVLVRTFDVVPGIDGIRDLRTAAEDVARRDGDLPIRVVALVVSPLEDLDVDDVVYDYLMEHPIVDETGARAKSLQIVAEVEGYYSVLPFTVP